jgi:prepilin-type N-terminal cleavage/methylation domain-containing protein
MELDPGGKLPMRQRGFSVVEVLIATLIFLIIAVGILPLFAASARNNLDGREATEVSNFGRSAIEDLLQAPISDPRLAVPSGSTVRVANEYWSKKDQVWKSGTGTSTDQALWRRQTRVRQYNVTNLSTPLDGGADAGQVHLKEVEVQVWHGRNQQSLALGGGRRFTVRMLKSK